MFYSVPIGPINHCGFDEPEESEDVPGDVVVLPLVPVLDSLPPGDVAPPVE